MPRRITELEERVERLEDKQRQLHRALTNAGVIEFESVLVRVPRPVGTRRFDDIADVLSQLCNILGYEIVVENPPRRVVRLIKKEAACRENGSIAT